MYLFYCFLNHDFFLNMRTVLFLHHELFMISQMFFEFTNILWCICIFSQYAQLFWNLFFLKIPEWFKERKTGKKWERKKAKEKQGRHYGPAHYGLLYILQKKGGRKRVCTTKDILSFSYSLQKVTHSKMCQLFWARDIVLKFPNMCWIHDYIFRNHEHFLFHCFLNRDLFIICKQYF